MIQPLGFEDKNALCHVYKIDKTMYGLKQAPRAWYSRLSIQLQAHWFVPSESGTSLFVYTKIQTSIFVLIYVDDIVVTSSSNGAVTT